LIYSKNRDIKTISRRKQLLVPRAKGFWQVGIISENNINAVYAEPLIDGVILKENILDQLRGNILKVASDTKIHFIGNDYIGTEAGQRFSVYPIETLRNSKALSFSEVNSENTENIFEQSTKDFLSSVKEEDSKNLMNEIDQQNFMLMRRNGHWILRSRLYFRQPSKKKFQDFDLKLMVPSSLIHYDEMDIPWNEIKAKQPWTTDAFMSPNKDIIVLVSENSLSINSIQKSSIVSKQLQKIPLDKGDTVVMAEWSIGRYADLWDKFVGKLFTADNVNSVKK
jgi:hypothetical protein